MNIDVAKLQARAESLRTRMAALRAAYPNPEGDIKTLFDLIYGLADDVLAGVELLADVAAETDRAGKRADDA